VTRTATAFRLGPLIRFAVVVFVIWTAVNWLADIPEIIALKEGVRHGRVSDEDIRVAKDAVAARLDALLGRTPASGTPRRESTPAAPRELPPAVTRRSTTADEARVPPGPSGRSDWSNVRLLQPPAAVRLPPGVSRAGDGVSMPRVVRLEKPKYTPEALQAKTEGTVVLNVVVRAQGRPAEISIVRSLDPGLDQEAIDAVRRWRFAPGQRDGQPVPVLVQIAIPFSLR
jgi:TonB family protein